MRAMRGAVAQARGALQAVCTTAASIRAEASEQPALAGVEAWKWSLSAPGLLETLALSSG